ncbi:MAG: hypothetical protein ISS72_08260 [Candidatus Brocadiae bacterium]|nr:hypothetical protein [Candidatus Brocadiia bacterium]
MGRASTRTFGTVAAGIFLAGIGWGQPSPVGVVSHVKVLSDKVPDVSSMEAWKQSFIRDGMTDAEKALAVWETAVAFRHQDAPPNEYLQSEGNVHDAIKMFNVYGYNMCCCASATIEQLARYVGLEARGYGITAHSVPEVYYDDAWHLLDASLIAYFPKPDGQLAGLEEMVAGVRAWLADHPELKGNNAKLMEFMRGGGWRNGPDILSRNPHYDDNGWLPAATHGWCSTMQEFDTDSFIYEYGYSQGYQVNIQLRPGERLTRNWSNKGLHVNMTDGDAPGCLNGTVGQGDLRYAPQYGDIAPGRIGNGALEYDVPLGDPDFRFSALTFENLTAAVAVDDPGDAGTVVLRMPSSYVYLGGEMLYDAGVGEGGSVTVLLSDNNGLDWRPINEMKASAERTVVLTPWVFRRYDYLLKFVLNGEGTQLNTLRLTHDIQHSQRPLPALAQGPNTITFSAAPQEGTVTIDTQTNPELQHGKQVYYMDYDPVLEGLSEQYMRVGDTGRGESTFRIATPGDMTRLRFGGHYRARDARDGWDLSVSFDDGDTFSPVDRFEGPTQGRCQYVSVEEIPADTSEALVRWSGQQYNTTCVFNLRIDADYTESRGGFRPVKVTYRWSEAGADRENVRIAESPDETYEIECAGEPRMKSIILELAE